MMIINLKVKKGEYGEILSLRSALSWGSAVTPNRSQEKGVKTQIPLTMAIACVGSRAALTIVGVLLLGRYRFQSMIVKPYATLGRMGPNSLAQKHSNE
jgi:hypothetical protein